MTVSDLEALLNDLAHDVRKAALSELVARVEDGTIRLPPPRPEVNIHLHSFFSYNANGWSPSRIAWEARKCGLEVAGIVDFDVLDGRDEFLEAGELLGMKAVVGLEYRVFVSELASVVTNSPNEPGIHYFMVHGCVPAAAPGAWNCECQNTLARLRETARRRNLAVMQKVNDYLGSVCLDYERDVLTLTPSGNATERHLLAGYDRKAREVHGDRVAGFWSAALGVTRDEVAVLMADTPAFHDRIRSRLMKSGGVGYTRPEPASFPTVEEVVAMAREMGAIPTTTWLDGTSEGESDMSANLELFVAKGAAAMNIIPDRNWNIRDREERVVKVARLRDAVEAAKTFDLPLSIGTEMNKAGQPFVDDFAAPELADCVGDFLSGAQFFYGHSLLARCCGKGFGSLWAASAFGTDRSKANRFYAEVGAAADASPEVRSALSGLRADADPGDVLAALTG